MGRFIWNEISSPDDFLQSNKDCLIFVLQGEAPLFERENSAIPWPNSLPVFDSLQQPQLVVEHLETEFLFGSILLSRLSMEEALSLCQQRMMAAGWEVHPISGAINSASSPSAPGFLLFHKRGKTCWLEARRTSVPQQTMVTLHCEKNST